MLLVIRGNPGWLRSVVAFGLSGWVHGLLLLGLVLSSAAGRPEPRRSLYDEMVRPHETHLVWYNLAGRLPDVSPSPAKKDAVRDRPPPRAREKFDQTLVAGAKDRPRQRQMIWMPEPAPVKTPAPKLAPLPNVLAVAPARPVRPFQPPAPPRIVAPAALPEAPEVAAPAMRALPLPTRGFTPPPQPKPALRAAALPEAPEVTAPAMRALPLPTRGFTPPPPPKPAPRAAALPEAPKVAALAADVPAYRSPALPASATRGFTPPPQPKPTVHATALPEAPKVAALAADVPAYRSPALPASATRGFIPPPPPKPAVHATVLPDAPSAPLAPEDAPPAPSLAIAGLDPARLTDIPKPPSPQEANFSASPKPRPEGSDGAADPSARMVVPGLLARGAGISNSPTAVVRPPPLLVTPRRPLFDALHPLEAVLPPPDARATRVSTAPDALLAGRAVYTMAIQMPNITSYSGSWMVWFAERVTVSDPIAIDPPTPRLKVDPKYVVAAREERVEGKVRLSAIIRKDGRVDEVVVLRHLDSRLDQTAQEALSKWIFVPARRQGEPIDVDAIFEIPFYLAPKPAR